MAIIKHIPVKNRYYSAAVEYLTCKFDEHTMKPLEDTGTSGNSGGASGWS